MLLIDGAIAAWNGLLVASYKVWCECVLGGICCQGECRCPDEEGECCENFWIEPSEECDEAEKGEGGGDCGTVEGLEGCYKCCVSQYETFVFEQLVPCEDDCGPEYRCCSPPLQTCTTFTGECDGEVLFGPCVIGCPKPCCVENDDGVVECSVVMESICTGHVDPGPYENGVTCDDACKGACCVDGELTENSPITQEECDALDGCWQGIGSTACGEGFCRPPFDENCCEHVVSSANSLTFTGPRRRRCPELDGCGFQVTVSVTTGQPVYVHGSQYGNPYEACTEVATFVTCNDTFHVTPAPCTGNLDKLDIEVCWDEGSGPELLRFHCCDTTYLLGNCDCGCVTTLLYEGSGCTSNATLHLRGDAVIDASGSGALVLTGSVSLQKSCDPAPTLTLTGVSTASNTIAGVISGTDLRVEKTGIGTWRLSSNSTYTGKLRVLDGTLVVASPVSQIGASAFGFDTSPNPELIGGSLLSQGVSIARPILVQAGPSQVVVLGATTGTATFSGGILLGSDVTLIAATGATAIFAGDWTGTSGIIDDPPPPAYAITVGSQGNSGVVAFDRTLPSEITAVTVTLGTARLLTENNRIDSGTPVTVGSSLGPATLDLNGNSQTLSNLTITGTSNSITGGTLRFASSPEVVVGGSGHEITSAVELDAALTISGSGTMLISGVVAGNNGITKTQSGTVRLSGTNTYTGTTTINGGTMKAENLAAFGTGAIVVNTGGTLDKNGFALANTITNNGGTVLN